MNSSHPPGITLPSNPVSSRWHACLISRTTYDQTFNPFPRVMNRATLGLLLVCLALSGYPASAIGGDVDTIKRAAEQGHAEAQYNLGVMYQQGSGVPQNYVEAARWYRRAAEQGDAEAQYNLGSMYFDGLGVPVDGVEAVRWLRMAAEQGDILAQYKLGVTYLYGLVEVRKDYVEAARWSRMAAEQGDARSQIALGLMYEYGEGVPKDYVQAYAWLSLAATQGTKPAEEKMEEISSNMTREEIASAQELARKYWDAYDLGRRP